MEIDLLPFLLAQIRKRQWGRDEQCSLEYHHILTICKTMWPDKLQLLSGYSKFHGHRIVLAVTGCTRQNVQLIPHGEGMQKLMALIAEEGFTEGLSWFPSLSYPTSRCGFLVLYTM